MTTALDLIKLSLKTAGVLAVGQIPLAEDVNDVFTVLNSMLASWNQSRLLVYHLLDISCQATGAQSYTVGPTGSFVVTRPDRLQAAYARITSGTPFDISLDIINTHEEYAEIAFKTIPAFPAAVFYDPTWPLGTLYVWPVPNSTFQIHIVVKETLSQFASLTSTINLPPEYFEALYYNLVGRIQLLYQLPVNPGVVALANSAINVIKVANSRVPELEMPYGLSGNTTWPYHGIWTTH